MTNSVVQIVKIKALNPVPAADNIEYVNVGGYQIIVKKGEFKPNDLGLFISVDSVLPDSVLDGYGLRDMISKGRVRTKKLRGMYSQGLILPLKPDKPEVLTLPPVTEGMDLSETLGIKKYEPPLKAFKQGKQIFNRPWPDARLIVFDIESLQHPRYHELFEEGEEVLITEKIHGKHLAAGIINGKYEVTSRKLGIESPTEEQLKEPPEKLCKRNEYWWGAMQADIEAKARQIASDYAVDDVVLRAELFGSGMQYLDYGRRLPEIAVFDIELGLGKFAPADTLLSILGKYKLPAVPLLYQGPFSMSKVEELAERDSVASNTKGQVSEGVVVKPVIETSVYPMLGRKILKYVSKRYAAKSADKEEKGIEVDVQD